MRAHHVIHRILEGVIKGVVNMALRGKVDDIGDAILVKNVKDEFLTCYIPPDKLVSDLRANICLTGTIVKAVQVVDQYIGGCVQNVVYEVRPYETTSSCDK